MCTLPRSSQGRGQREDAVLHPALAPYAGRGAFSLQNGGVFPHSIQYLRCICVVFFIYFERASEGTSRARVGVGVAYHSGRVGRTHSLQRLYPAVGWWRGEMSIAHRSLARAGMALPRHPMGGGLGAGRACARAVAWGAQCSADHRPAPRGSRSRGIDLDGRRSRATREARSGARDREPEGEARGAARCTRQEITPASYTRHAQ